MAGNDFVRALSEGAVPPVTDWFYKFFSALAAAFLVVQVITYLCLAWGGSRQRVEVFFAPVDEEIGRPVRRAVDGTTLEALKAQIEKEVEKAMQRFEAANLSREAAQLAHTTAAANEARAAHETKVREYESEIKELEAKIKELKARQKPTPIGVETLRAAAARTKEREVYAIYRDDQVRIAMMELERGLADDDNDGVS